MAERLERADDSGNCRWYRNIRLETRKSPDYIRRLHPAVFSQFRLRVGK
ncbi:hypothetical protein [Sphingorhabdus profundilacus]|nr:hypothetical protein [Sphingorhabdus profundilacus]